VFAVLASRFALFRRRRALAPALAALVSTLSLAACESPGTDMILSDYIAPTYNPTLLNAAARYDAVPVEVTGNPFGGDKERLTRVIADSVRETPLASRIPFAPATAAMTAPYRLVVIFDPARNLGFASVCERGSRRQAETPGPGLRMMMTYCLGRDAITSLRLRHGGFDGAEGPDTPAFRRLVQNATAALFPPRTEIRGNNGDGDGFF